MSRSRAALEVLVHDLVFSSPFDFNSHRVWIDHNTCSFDVAADSLMHLIRGEASAALYVVGRLIEIEQSVESFCQYLDEEPWVAARREIKATDEAWDRRVEELTAMTRSP